MFMELASLHIRTLPPNDWAAFGRHRQLPRRGTLLGFYLGWQGSLPAKLQRSGQNPASVFIWSPPAPVESRIHPCCEARRLD